ERYAGRKSRGERRVLVELFTGAESPFDVPAELAFDALARGYGPGEVALLQYHVHVPGPDPLTNPDGEARAKYYGPKLRGTPTTFFNGKEAGRGGGDVTDAKPKFTEYKRVIDPALET